MKTSTLVLSFCGFCILYISNADWIDELYEKFVESYLITDYEEVAPFVSSVTAGTEEFDKLLEELNQSKQKWYHFLVNILLLIFLLPISSCLFWYAVLFNRNRILNTIQYFLSKFCPSKNFITKNQEKFQDVGIMEIFESKYKNTCGVSSKDDVPVKLLWKGGTFVESSIHCNIKDDIVDSKILNMQKHFLQSTLLLQCSDIGGGDKKLQLSQVSSDESTALKIAEICKLLESEPEMINRFVDLKEKPSDFTKIKKSEETHGVFKNSQNLPLQECFSNNRLLGVHKIEQKKSFESKCKDTRESMEKSNKILEIYDEKQKITKTDKLDADKSEWDGSPDSRLMNRIRLLESRLRLEELKNKNWIKRMSRAEGILHQLNKQVERIEEAQPMGTRTEMLKITSTVTNWSLPRKNTQFTLINQYQPFYSHPPCMSLSEVIKKEIGLPFSSKNNKVLYPITPTPSIPVPVSPNIKPQYLFLSKFISK